MTTRHDRNFWVIDDHSASSGIVNKFVDLEKRWIDTNGDHTGEVAYQYYEIFHCPPEFYTDTENDYERNGCRLLPNDVVVDVGGNMGIFARRAWERGASKIISFEPQRITYQCYLKNAKPEMVAFNCAISDKIGVCEIKSGGSRKTGGGSIIESYDQQENDSFRVEDVITLTLDKLFETPLFSKVDFLKIDVEGAETLVLKGISDENLVKFRCISMEVHRNVVDDETREKMIDRITKLGYKHFAMFYSQSLITYNFWK